MPAGRALLPASVVRAFELEGEAVPLSGGQGSSVRVGDAVLKPGSDEAVTAWLDDVGRRIVHLGFRLPLPLRARDGSWVVDGWSAFEHVVGDAEPDGRWDEVMRAGRDLHAALADEVCPPFLVAREDRWAIADRVAWGGHDVAVGPVSARLLSRLRAQYRPVRLPAQLVHGDLSGNVLFADGLDPAVIDVSPYWRPAPYADAVVVVDALLWWGAHESLLEAALPPGSAVDTWHQLLLRAAVFRLVSLDELGRADDPEMADQLPLYDRVVTLLERCTTY